MFLFDQLTIIFCSFAPFSILKDAMAERLRIKAELKKKATKPMGYKESMEAEKNKQKSLQKSKEAQRAAMCEELGRGC